LITSGYSVGDLMAPVNTDFDFHNSTITAPLLGFMYFLLFEFVYHKQIYKGAVGRNKFPQCFDAIQFFIDVATDEYQFCFGVDDSMNAADQRNNILKFYK